MKRITFSSLLTTLALFSGSSLPVHAQSVTNTHILVIQDVQQPLETYVNGFPLQASPGTNTQTTRLTADAYLVNGTNEFRLLTVDSLTNVLAASETVVGLRLNFFSLELPEGTNLFDLERKARPLGTNGLEEVIAFTNQAGAEIGMTATLTDTRSVAQVDDPGMEGRIRVLRGSGTNELRLTTVLSNLPLSSLPWLSTAPLPLTEQDTNELRSLTAALHAGFTNRSVSALTNLLRTKITRVAPCRGFTFQEEAAQRGEFFSKLFSLNPHTVAALNTNNLSFRAYPRANLLQILHEGQPPILVTAEGFRYRLPVYVSKLGGLWTIVD